MAANSFRLRTFGGLHLERTEAERVPGEALQRRLLLVALAAEAGDRGISRDRVIGLLWPESDEEHGRRSLNQLRYTLRRELGGIDLVVGTSTLRVDPARLESDLAEFRAAIARGDAEAASAIHAAPFLDGIFAEGAPELDQWVEDRRREFRTTLEEVLLRTARSTGGADEGGAALNRWRRLVELDPLNAVYAVGAMEALARRGDATGALVVAARHEATVLRELGVPPDRAVAEAAARIRGHTRPVRSGNRFGAGEPAGMPDPRPSAEPAALPVAAPRRRRWVGLTVGLLLTALGGAGLARVISGPESIPRTPPRLVVALSWPGDAPSAGERDAMRVVELALRRGAAGLELPAPVARATLRRMRRTDSTRTPDEETAREVAQREGLPWVVVGAAVETGGRFAVRYQVEEAGNGRIVRSRQESALSRADVPAAADRLVDRLTGDLRGLGPGPAMEPMPYVTTASLEALRAYRGASRLVNSGDRSHMAQLERAVALDSNFAAAHALLAYGYWFGYDQPRADLHAQAAERSLAGLEPGERLWIAREVANSREEWPTAIANARAMVERNRQSSPAWHALAQLLYFDGQFARSVDAYDSAMAYAGADDTLTLLINRATVLARQRRYLESADYYRRAFARDSLLLDDPFVYLEFGAVLVHLGRAAEARSVFQRPLAGSARDRAAALRALALLEAFEGHYHRARELLEEAATASTAASDGPGRAVAHTLLAEVRPILGEESAARAELDSVASIAAQTPLPYEVLSRGVKLASRIGATNLAGALLARLQAQTRSRSSTAQARLLMARGELALSNGRIEEGRRALEQALALDRADDLLESSAHAALADGASRMAATRFDSLAAGEGLDWDGYAVRGLGHYWAADAWERAGDPVMADAAYRAFASAWKDGDEGLRPLRRARERLGVAEPRR